MQVKAGSYTAIVREAHIVSFCEPSNHDLFASPAEGGAGLQHCFMRAPVDNDIAGPDKFVPWMPRWVWKVFGLLSHRGYWQSAGLIGSGLESVVDSSEWTTTGSGIPCLCVVERFITKTNLRTLTLFHTVVTYTFKNEEITISVSVKACGPALRLPSLPRIGMVVALTSRLRQLTWLGCGPGESYPDRKAATDWAVHCSSVDEEHVDYIVPSECGGKSDVFWTALMDPIAPGTGLLVEYVSTDVVASEEGLTTTASQRPAGTRGAQLSTSRWTLAELTAARHRHELPHHGDALELYERPVQLHIDTAHMGVGAEGGLQIWAAANEFLVKPGPLPWTYELNIRPLRGPQ